MKKDFVSHKIEWFEIDFRPDVNDCPPDLFAHYEIVVSHQGRETVCFFSFPKVIPPNMTHVMGMLAIENSHSFLDKKTYDLAKSQVGDKGWCLFSKDQRDLIIQRVSLQRVFGQGLFDFLFRPHFLSYTEKTKH